MDRTGYVAYVGGMMIGQYGVVATANHYTAVVRVYEGFNEPHWIFLRNFNLMHHISRQRSVDFVRTGIYPPEWLPH